MSEPEHHHIAVAELTDMLAGILTRAGASEHVAATLSANCVACERDGSKSHGIFRMTGYVNSIRSGWVDATAVPVLEDVAPSMLRVDARNGFAQVALAAARESLIAKARTNGIAIAAIRGSHHLSALWPDVEPFADAGLIALSVVNSYAYAVPIGGHKAVLGTNPIAYAIPRHDASPIVVDFATSAIPNGDVQLAARSGTLLPEGVAVDGEGKPTRDAKLVLSEGALLPFGGRKGGALAILVEILAAGLTGGHYSYEVDWTAHPGAQTPHTGQTVILIDPDRGHPGNFDARIAGLVETLRDAGMDSMPGERRIASRARAAEHGIPLTAAELRILRDLG